MKTDTEKLENMKAVARDMLSYCYPRTDDSPNGNDWMNGTWHGLYNFVKQTGLLSAEELRTLNKRN